MAESQQRRSGCGQQMFGPYVCHWCRSIASSYIGAVSLTKRCLSFTLQTRSVCTRSKLCGITPRLTVQFPGTEADKERCEGCELGHHVIFVLAAGYTQMLTWHLVDKKMGEHLLKASVFEPYPELEREDGPDDCDESHACARANTCGRSLLFGGPAVTSLIARAALAVPPCT